MSNYSTHKVQESSFKLSWYAVGNFLAIVTSILFWLIQVSGSSFLIDLFNALILTSAFFLFSFRQSFLGMALICGYLAGSLQGVIISDTVITEGVILTTSITSLVLSIFLIISRGRFNKVDLRLLFAVIFIPVFFAAASFALSNYLFIFSEFKKFLMFIIFFTLALTFDHSKLKELIHLSANSIFGVSLLAIFAFNTLSIEYNYGGLIYAAIPSSILLIPILYLFYQSRTFLIFTLFIVFSLALGFIQPSAKLLIILFCILILELRKLSALRILSIAALILAINFASLEFDNMTNYKFFSLLSSFESIIEIITLGAVSNSSIFFFTSVGNIVAEFITVLGVLSNNFYLPIGTGFVLPDLYGWLSFANDSAYHPASTPYAKYPLHLGFYYLMIWYGPFMIIFKNIKTTLIFLISFSLFSLSAPTLICLSAILTSKNTSK